MSGILKKTTAMAALLAALTSYSQAAILLGNTGQTASGGNNAVNDLNARGFGFNSPNAGTLGNVTISLQRTTGSGNTGIAASLALYASISGIPTTSPVATFTVPDLSTLSTTAASYTFTPTAYSLTANTDYYLVLRNSGASNLRWAGTAGTSPLSNSSVAAASTGASGAVNLARPDLISDFTTGTTTTKYLVEVNYTPVPEPETYAMLAGLGLVGFAFVRRTKAA